MFTFFKFTFIKPFIGISSDLKVDFANQKQSWETAHIWKLPNILIVRKIENRI